MPLMAITITSNLCTEAHILFRTIFVLIPKQQITVFLFGPDTKDVHFRILFHKTHIALLSNPN